MSELREARNNRRLYLINRIRELYSAGKKPVEIAKKLGITEERVQYYLR